MKSFIGIQLPPDLRHKITEFRRKNGYESTEPHIKLISPHLLEKTRIFEQKIESFCLAQTDFKLVVARPSNYNNEILFLTVLPGAINMVRDNLARHLKVNSRAVFRPHLTIMRQDAETSLDLDQYLEEARTEFGQPYSLNVTALTLYTQKDNQPYFQPVSTIPFSGR